MKTQMLHKVLTIAGFDGSGGAGIQGDLKTISALGCYGMTVLTALPIQNTLGVKSVYAIDATCVAEQLETILEDIAPDAIKIGMLHRREIIESIAPILKRYSTCPIVLDPVMLAKSGHHLLSPDAIACMKHLLFPLTTILTPNLPEASLLVGREITTKNQMETAALELLSQGPKVVILKGGHLLDDTSDDLLCLENTESKENLHWLRSPRMITKNTHGTGCTFSAALAAYLAKGLNTLDAAACAKNYISMCIAASSEFKIGRGHGPLHHFASLWKEEPLGFG